MGTSSAVKAIQAQFKELVHDPPPGINAGPLDDDWMEWSAVIQGPEGTPYEGGLFFLSIQFSDSFPFDPPKVRFTTPIFHPNVNDEGGICLSILFKSCSWDNGWTPSLSISAVLISIMVLMSEPATDHSLQPEMAKLYDTDRAAFDKAAREHTKQHAM